jgi:hypothetical protein
MSVLSLLSGFARLFQRLGIHKIDYTCLSKLWKKIAQAPGDNARGHPLIGSVGPEVKCEFKHDVIRADRGSRS